MGQFQREEQSRFIAEIPEEFVEEIRPRVQVSRPMHRTSKPRGRSSANEAGGELGMHLGQRVRHAKFGDGIILNFEGQGAHTRVHVNFENAGTKILIAGYANLDLM